MATSHESLPSRSRSPGRLTRLPPVRLASREELAAAARVAPLLRVARDLAAWARPAQPVTTAGELAAADAAAAAAVLDLSAEETRAAWAVAIGTGMVAVSGRRAGPGTQFDVLTSGGPGDVLDVWCAALQAVLGQENMDGLATALYTAARPVRLDALFEAYAAAVGALTVSADDGMLSNPNGTDTGIPADHAPADQGPAPWDQGPAPADQGPAPADQGPAPGDQRPASVDQNAVAVDQESAPAFPPGLEPGLESGLELLADLGVVELGAEDDNDEAGLTVTLSPIGVWAVRDRLSARGWRVPVLGGSAEGGAAAVLAVLADYDAEDGEAEIAAWLGRRSPEQAAEELTEAASQGSPGLRGAAFAVMDRVGAAAVPAVRRALANPVLRPHAAVWLREHGEEAGLSREDSAWLLVDLGAGLLEEAAPEDVVAELLPELPPHAQADLVAMLWRVEHPAVTDLLTTLSDHHPDPDVANAARKAAFKARSRL